MVSLLVLSLTFHICYATSSSIDHPAWCPPPKKSYFGQCMECPPGYKPPDCSPCEDGYYGPACTLQCHCISGCVKRTGKCLDISQGCIGGYDGGSCARSGYTCRFGHGNHYSECMQICSLNCKDGICAHDHNMCYHGCEPNWFGIHCDHQCQPGKFGNKCQHSCTCSVNCDQETGTCSGSSDVVSQCQQNYHGPTCQAHNILDGMTIQRVELFPAELHQSGVTYSASNAVDGDVTSPDIASSTEAVETRFELEWGIAKRIKFVLIYTDEEGHSAIQSTDNLTVSLVSPGQNPASCAISVNGSLVTADVYLYKMDCPIYVAYSSVNVTLSNVSGSSLRIRDIQLYECVPGMWGPWCENQCKAVCFNTPHCDWDYGVCEVKCHGDWSSHGPHSNVQCDRFERFAIYAPPQVILGNSMLVFSVWTFVTDKYHIITSSGYGCDLVGTRTLLPSIMRGEMWLSLQEARELGAYLNTSLELAVPQDLSFSCYTYDDPIIILLSRIPVTTNETYNATCTSIIMDCDNGLDSCSYSSPPAGCQKPCGGCITAAPNILKINIGLGDGTYRFHYGHRYSDLKTASVEYVTLESGEGCVESKKIIGTSVDPSNPVVWYFKKAILLSVTLDFNCTEDNITQYDWTLRNRVYEYEMELPGKVFDLGLPSVGHAYIPANAITEDILVTVECLVHFWMEGILKRELVKGYMRLSGTSNMVSGEFNVDVKDKNKTGHAFDETIELAALVTPEMVNIDAVENWRYVWFCERTGGLPCNLDNVTSVYSDNSIGISNATFTIPEKKLNLYELYTFTVYAVSKNHVRASLPAALHFVMLLDLSVNVGMRCIQNCRGKLNPEENYVLECFSIDSPISHCSWDVFENNVLSNYKAEVHSSTGRYNQRLEMFDSFFEIDETYMFLVKVTTENGNERYSMSYVVSNAVPLNGTCTIDPVEGTALETEFNITCIGFDDVDLPLEYVLYVLQKNKGELRVSASYKNTFLTTLPPGQYENSTVHLKVEVFDSHALSTSFNLQAKSEFPTLVEADLLFLASTEISHLNVSAGREITVEDLQTISIVANVLGMETDSNATQPENVTEERNQIRKVILTALTETKIEETEVLLTVTSITETMFKDAEEFTEDMEESGVSLVGNLTASLTMLPETSVRATRDISRGILKSIGSLLASVNKPSKSVLKDGRNQTSSDSSLPQIMKKKSLSTKMIDSIQSVAGVLTNTLLPRQEPIKLDMDVMSLHLQKTPGSDLAVMNESTVIRQAQDGTNLSLSVKYPDVDALTNSNPIVNDDKFICNLQVVLYDINPYQWDETSKNITSPVVADVSMKSENNEEIHFTGLQDPLSLQFPTGYSEAGLKPQILDLEVTLSSNFTVMNSSVGVFNITSKTELFIEILDMDSELVPKMTYKVLVSPDEEDMVNTVISEKGIDYPPLRYVEQVVFHNNNSWSNNSWSNNSFVNESSYSNITGNENYTAETITTVIRDDFLFIPLDEMNKAVYVGIMLGLGQNFSHDVMNSSESNSTGKWQNRTGLMDGESQVVNISILVRALSVYCLSYNTVDDIWSSDGCKVSSTTSKDMMTCHCSHLSVFSGGVFVAPNVVDPTDIGLFLTFFSNPIIVCTVIVIWTLYLFLLIWARRADKRDFHKGGVTVLEDNKKDDRYLYLIGIVTGWWKNAGTSSNVYMFLLGSKGQSSRHAMTDGISEHFQVGKEDWFLLTTPSSLGKLESVTIWHDNSGQDPEWFLKQIIVRDIQDQKTYHFLFNDWLAVDRGSRVLKATVKAVGDMKSNRAYNFGLKSTRDLQTNHLWVSIFSCPPESSFTRAQRLSVALSLLILTMLTSLMFHGIPTDDPEDQLKHGSISISLSDIVIGLQSGLIMFPITFLIMQLFTRVSPRPSAKEVKNKRLQATDTHSAETATECKGKVPSNIITADKSNNRQLPSGSGYSTLLPSSSVSWMINKNESVVKNRVKQQKSKQPFRFPWWFIYIAWTLVIATSLISSYFVMLYGLMYGYAKSVDWMVSFFTAFFQSALITQPLKVFIMAMLITVILKKPVEFQQLEEKRCVEIEPDEEYLNKDTLIKQGVYIEEDEEEKPVTVAESMPQKALKAIKKRLKLESEISQIIQEIVMYFSFVTIVVLVVHGHSDVQTNYQTTRVIEDMFVNGLYDDDHLSLEEVERVNDLWQYLSDTMGAILYRGPDLPVASNVSYLLGTARLRLKRIQPDVCSFPKQMQHLFEHKTCKDGYWTGSEDDKSYNASWEIPVSSNDYLTDHWKFQSAWDLKTIPYMGKLATYTGSGYVIELSPDYDDVRSVLNDDLQVNDWISEMTSALFVEFSLYNLNVHLISVVMILFEFSPTGKIVPSYQIFTAKLYHYQNGLEIFVAVVEALFVVFVLYFTYFEYKKFRKLKRVEYLSDTWSYVEMAIIALSYTSVGLFFQRLVTVNNIMQDYLKVKQQSFTNFYTAVSWDFILGYVQAFLVLLVILKLLKTFRFNPKTNMLTDTLSVAKKSLISHIFVMFMYGVAFAHCGVLLFGTRLLDYRDFLTALLALFNFALGVSDYIGIEEANRVLGPLYFFTFFFLIQYVLLVIFISILMIAFAEAMKTYRTKQGDIPVTWFLYNHVIKMVGFKREKDLLKM